MKILVFGSIYWGCEQEANDLKFQTNEWYLRCLKYLKPSTIFMTSGCYCNPEYNFLPSQLVQLNIPKIKEQTDDWNYWRVAFSTGLYHCLLNYTNWDLIIHAQTNFLIGENLLSNLYSFLESDKLMYSYKISSFWGTGVETAFMALKRDAVHRFINQPLRQNLSNQKTICVEKEMYELFKDEWYNANHEISCLRKNIIHGYHMDPSIYRDFSMSDEVFYNLKNIVGMKHCSSEELSNWCRKNPV